MLATPTQSYSAVKHEASLEEQLRDSEKQWRGMNRRKIFCCIILSLCMIGVAVGLLVYFEPFKKNHHIHSCQERKLIIVSLDGFRATYLNESYQKRWNISTPHINSVIRNGVHIERMIPVFPSLTFPNHYTLATGLYPGWHGIVSNSFIDMELDESFSMGTIDSDGRWYRGHPIWNTMRLNGNHKLNLSSAVVFWVGSEQNASGEGYPDYYLHYNGSMPFNKRIDTGLDLLHTGDYQLLMMYFEEPDHHGHQYGPESNYTSQWVQKMDGWMGYMLDGIESRRLGDTTDIIILSDHGMTSTPDSKLIYLNQSIFDPTLRSEWIVKSKSPMTALWLTDNSTYSADDVVDLIQSSVMNDSQSQLFSVWKQGNIPYEYNIGYHDRTPDVIALPKLGWSFHWSNMSQNDQYWIYDEEGNHGYNNSDLDMSALFVAKGPSFKRGYKRDKVENLHVYSLACHLLCEMTPSPNNGSLKEIQDVLENEPTSSFF